MSNKKTVLLLFGGESSEHEVSLASASNVQTSVDRNLYEVVLCYIDKQGAWWMVNTVSETGQYQNKKSATPLIGKGALLLLETKTVIHIDVILPIMHGSGGEDGSIQGLTQLLHVAIVGCGLTSSVLCMDKALTKQVAAQHNIPTTPGVIHYTHENLSFDQVSQQLGPKLFIKPASQGSSVGVSKATNEIEFNSAVKIAHSYGNKILIEQAITAREIEVAVFSDHSGTQVSVIGEIVPDREFYDYESKYDSQSKSQAIIPAKIDGEIADVILHYARAAFEALGCQGLARVDFFLDEQNRVFLNEINTMPGFTDISMYPKLWEVTGWTQKELITKLIESAR